MQLLVGNIENSQKLGFKSSRNGQEKIQNEIEKEQWICVQN